MLITGSARNTGLGIAAAFVREGANVAIHDLYHGDVEAAAASLREKLIHEAAVSRDAATTRILALPGDIRQPAAIEAMFDVLQSRWPRLDGLVSNAAAMGVGYSFQDTPRDMLEQVIDVNVKGLFVVAQHAARWMIQQASGTIVHISSNVADRAIRHRAAYVASKAAVDGLTRAMAIDLAPHHVRVNSVAAGYINTERWAAITPEHAARRRENIPLGQEASADDIAQAVLFLASNEARHITGARLVVDGGCAAQHLPMELDV